MLHDKVSQRRFLRRHVSFRCKHFATRRAAGAFLRLSYPENICQNSSAQRGRGLETSGDRPGRTVSFETNAFRTPQPQARCRCAIVLLPLRLKLLLMYTHLSRP